MIFLTLKNLKKNAGKGINPVSKGIVPMLSKAAALGIILIVLVLAVFLVRGTLDRVDSKAFASGSSTTECPHCKTQVYELYECPNENCEYYRKVGCTTEFGADENGDPKCLYKALYYKVICKKCNSKAKKVWPK